MGAVQSLSGRLGRIALKRGAAGGHCYAAAADGVIAWPPCPVEVTDPTGAGDAFAGGFLTGQLAGLTLGECLARGGVSASFAIETWGPAGLLAATPEEVRRRHDAWRDGFIG